MKPKIIGCCTKCDKEVFDVLERYEDRRPKRIGAPREDAMRLTFILASGSRMDLTFCAACVNGSLPDDIPPLSPVDYPHIWNRVRVSWEAASPGHEWNRTQKDNAILTLLKTKPWTEVA